MAEEKGMQSLLLKEPGLWLRISSANPGAKVPRSYGLPWHDQNHWAEAGFRAAVPYGPFGDAVVVPRKYRDSITTNPQLPTSQLQGCTTVWVL